MTQKTVKYLAAGENYITFYYMFSVILNCFNILYVKSI